METFSYIELDFSEDLTASEYIAFDFGDGDGTVSVLEEFTSVRYESGKVGIPDPTGTAGEASAQAFAEAFSADYNVGGVFVVTIEGTLVTISSTVYGIDFDNADVPDSVTAGTGTGTIPFSIGSVTFQTSGSCETVNVRVSTTEIADEILSPYVAAVSENPIIFEWNRSQSFELHVRKGSVHKYKTVIMPSRLFPSGITLNINDNPAGSSVTIVAHTYQLTFTYSLNGVDYQSSNVFSNLVGGAYTAYVKDQFGCVVTKAFELDGFGINSPFFYLPTANSIRFANRVTWGDCGNYKNDFNTLSCEADVPLPYKEIQQFQSCDVIKTQFKSNYATHTVEIGSTEIPVNKKTDFMRRKDSRDAFLCNLGDDSARTGIYFTSGNLYNYDTGADIGDYTLNGALPEWGVAGNYVKHPNGNWYLIEEVIYLESRNAEVLVIDTGIAPVNDVGGIVSCFYNLKNYEVYEFTIDFATYIGQDIQVRILAVDTYFDEVEFLSEVINVQVRHKNTVEIRYSNDENTDVYYASGIEHKIRLPLERSYGKPSGNNESYDTDNDTILINADIRQLDVFDFSPMTKQMMWKVDEALSHKFVFIDGVRYGEKQIDVSEVLGETNLYDVTATMKKANSQFTSNGSQFDESGLEIPALIQAGTGFVKYQ